MEVKAREIYCSITITLICFLIGLCIYNNILTSKYQENQKYNTAVNIENQANLFQYAIDTEIGNVLAYGNITAVSPVTDSNIEGKYMYVEKETYKYTMHTRVVKSGNKSKVEIYYTWDLTDVSINKTDKIKFLDTVLEYNNIKFKGLPAYHLKTVKKNLHTKYVYNVVDTSFYGTLYCFMEDKQINNVEVFSKKTIPETLEYVNNDVSWKIVFWILWLMVTSFLIYIFIKLDNDWLD